MTQNRIIWAVGLIGGIALALRFTEFSLGGDDLSEDEWQEIVEEQEASYDFWSWSIDSLMEDGLDASGVDLVAAGINQFDDRHAEPISELKYESDDIETYQEAVGMYEAWRDAGMPQGGDTVSPADIGAADYYDDYTEDDEGFNFDFDLDW